MVEPFTMIAAAAVVGGATGKFVEKAWDAGENWISSYFENHGAKAKDQARKNSFEFLSNLAKKVETLEKKDKGNKIIIENALSHPDFSALLQKAILSSAQTENKQKHELLARLIRDRLTMNSESIHALTSKLAADAISAITVNQLKLLCLIMNIKYIIPTEIPSTISSQEEFNKYVTKWLDRRFSNITDVNYSSLDFDHLEALSCLTVIRFGSTQLYQSISTKFENDKFQVNITEFINSKLGKKISEMWNDRLGSAILTSVGQLIGMYVSDVLTGVDTNLSNDWK